MKQLLSLLLFITLIVLPLSGKQKIEGSAINVGALLVEEPSIEKMVELCTYYNLTPSIAENEYTVFYHSDGTQIRFKMEEDNDPATLIVEIISNEKPKKIEEILIGLGFKRSDKGFVKGRKSGYDLTLVRITPTTPRILTFSKIKRK